MIKPQVCGPQLTFLMSNCFVLCFDAVELSFHARLLSFSSGELQEGMPAFLISHGLTLDCMPWNAYKVLS